MHRLKTLSILFIEDNEAFAKNTIDFLQLYFGRVLHTKTLKDALNLFETEDPDLILSDIKVEDGNGLEFIQQVRRRNKEIPIIVMSAHKEEEFLFKAIPLGILSYEVKPINYENFLSLLKKISQHFKELSSVQISPNLLYDHKNKKLLLETQTIALTKKEMLFIELLLKYPQQIVSNDMIQNDVWEQTIMSDSAIKNLIFRLRKKVNQDFIQTIHSVGYKLITKRN
ncbi:MAG: response regulator transcription factor [Helicobacteraceae bacterium]|nr:response regulator transcription factor [Helicobacteraceae bacterium]